ncbi:hypothetical protein P692DRAFT_20723417, partial [Suillus brevipes Sb2]
LRAGATSMVRLDFPTGTKLKFQWRDTRGDGRGVSVGRALNRRKPNKLRQLRRDEFAGSAKRSLHCLKGQISKN